MNDKQRAEFENYEPSNEYFNLFGGHQFDKSASGDYIDDETQRDWIIWQAAIASVVVELPESYGVGEVYLPAVIRALDEAGIRYE